VILVWLEWPEACFRANRRDIKYLASLLHTPEEIKCVKCEADFLQALPGARVAIVWHFKKEWYRAAKELKVLATPGAGRELVAWQAAPRGVRVHFGSFHGAIISESVAAFCLAWARGFFKVERHEGGIWPRSWLGEGCYTVAGTRAVIAGYGKIGKAIGEKLSGLGVKVSGFGRKNIEDLPEAATKADWFIMALPGDTGTDDFLSTGLISKLSKKCVVVNVGRGNAIDEECLCQALESGRIAGAYLDVFKNEPTVVGQKSEGGNSGLAFKKLPNLVSMPHSSAYSPDYIRMAFKELSDEGYL